MAPGPGGLRYRPPSLHSTTPTLHTQFRVGRVDPRIFGGFLEHVGRAVYQGVYDPGSVRLELPTLAVIAATLRLA